MAQTVLQQSLSEHPGSVCAVRQLSVPLPQFCAVLHGVKANVSELNDNVSPLITDLLVVNATDHIKLPAVDASQIAM